MSTEPPTGRMSDEGRRRALAQAVARAVAEGARVESQTDMEAVVVRGRRPNHLLHFIIGLVTLSAWWWLVWLPLGIFGGEKRTVLLVDEYGTVQAHGKARKLARAYKPRDPNQHWLLAWANVHPIVAGLLAIFAGSVVVGFVEGVASAATERTAVAKVIQKQDRRWWLEATVDQPGSLVVQVGAKHRQSVQVTWSTDCGPVGRDTTNETGKFATRKSVRRTINVSAAAGSGRCLVSVFAQEHGTGPVSVRVRGVFGAVETSSVKRLDNLPYPAPPLF